MAQNRTIYEIMAKAVGFKSSEQQVKGLKKSLGGLKTAALGVAGAYFGSQALIGGIRASIEAFGEQEAAEKKLEQALGKTSDKLLQQASALQEVSTFGDEAVISQMAFLGSIGMTEEQISDILPVAADLATATGMTLESAVRNTAKTFSGLAGELGELVPQIRDLTAEEMKAGEAVKVMGDLFKGQALSSTKSFQGQVAQLQNAMGDIGETIGGLLVDNGALGALVTWATEADEAFRFFFGTLENKKQPLTDTETAIEAIEQKMEHQMEVMAEWAEKSSDEDYIREQANMRMKTEVDIRQTVADTIVRHAETYNELNAELERTKEHQEFLAENLPLVNEAYQNIAVSLNEEVIPAQTTTNNNYMQQQEHSTKVRELTRQELAQYKLLVGAKKVGAAIEVAANANIAGSFAAINEATDGNAKLTKNLTIAQAIADAYAGGARAFRDHVAPASWAIAASSVAMGLANVINIEKAYQQSQSAQYGFEGVIDEPTQFTVGEGGAAEYVSVTPMEGVNNAEGGGATIVIQGNVMTDDFVENELAEKIAEAVRRGTDFGIS